MHIEYWSNKWKASKLNYIARRRKLLFPHIVHPMITNIVIPQALVFCYAKTQILNKLKINSGKRVKKHCIKVNIKAVGWGGAMKEFSYLCHGWIRWVTTKSKIWSGIKLEEWNKIKIVLVSKIMIKVCLDWVTVIRKI